MQLVDEQDDLALGAGDLLEDCLEPLLELAPVLGASDKRAEVERDDATLLQPLGHVAADDSLRETLGDRRLANARFSDEDGVVLGAAREHLDDAPNLLVTSDDGVELAGARGLGEVTAVLLERLILALGVLIGHALVAADIGHGLVETLAADAVGLEKRARLAADRVVQHGNQEMLGRDEFVLEAASLGLGDV